MTDITTEKARIGAPSAQPFINGFTEEGESLSPVNAAASKAPLAGEAVKRHSHGGGVPHDLTLDDVGRLVEPDDSASARPNGGNRLADILVEHLAVLNPPLCDNVHSHFRSPPTASAPPHGPGFSRNGCFSRGGS